MKSINVYIGKTCNLNCIYCYVKKDNRISIFNKNKFIEFCKELKKYKISNITITGGEPLLNQNLIDYLEIAFSFGLDVHLLTNGLLKLDKTILNYLTSITLSIDGDLNEMDINRNIKNLKTIEMNIQEILSSTCDLKVNCVVTKLTLESFSMGLREFILRNKIDKIIKEIKINSVDSSNNKIKLNQNDYPLFFEGIRKISKFNIKISTNVLNLESLMKLEKTEINLPLWYSVDDNMYYIDKKRKFNELNRLFSEYKIIKNIFIQRLKRKSVKNKYFLFSEGLNL